MPSAEDLVAGLTAIANEWQPVATAWHVFLAVLLVSLYLGWRPSARLLTPMLLLPLVGVSVVASLSGNAFNASIFAGLALILGALASTRSDATVKVAPTRLIVIGAGLVGFGATYPHFVDAGSWLAYAYVAPLGIVPCPTLAVIIGVSLMLNGLGSPAWSGILAAAGVFYAVVGVIWFEVMIDVVLLAGALVLAAHAVTTHHGRLISAQPIAR
jgi:hypothetical protein